MRVYLLLIHLSLFISSALAQQTYLHHKIEARVDPTGSGLQVVDEIAVPEDFFSGQIVFYLNSNLSVETPDPGARLELLGTEEPADDLGMDRDIGDDDISSKVSKYRYLIPDELTQSRKITLKYRGAIKYQISSSGPEYARSFSESPGIISEEGVFLAGSTYWIPHFDSRLYSFEMKVDLPSGWKAVSQGQRTEASDENDRHVETWDFPHPAEEVFLIAARFTEYSFSAGAVEAMAFLRAPDDALAAKYLETTAQYLEMYRKLVGPFPFTKFALVENFWETGYGMPSFTLLGPRVIRFPFILHSSYPHELLHNWWGNSVYVDFDSGNWCEGLTAYMADHLISEQRGQGAEYRRTTLQGYTDYVNTGNDFAVSQFRSRSSASTQAIGYGKTLMVWHMLRRKFGDDVFSKVFQGFYQKYRFKRASFSDIRKEFEEVTGADLGPFFQQWIEGLGAPEIEIASAGRNKLGTGYSIDVSIRQKGAQTFAVDVPLAVYTETGVITRSVSISGRETRFQVTVPVEPIKLAVDPEFDTFRKLDPFETPPSLSKVFGAEAVMVVLPSASETLEMYRGLAQKWADGEKDKFEIALDKEVEDFPENKAVWILGKDNLKAAQVTAALKKYDVAVSNSSIDFKTSDFDFQGHSVVAAVRHPYNPNSAMVWLSVDRSAAVAGLIRKLPHYGKYSYLVFTGDEPDNIAKGQWPAVNSPLVHRFKESDRVLADLPKRQALAVLPPVFSGEKMMETIRFLASEDLRGRGIDQPEIDEAAEFIKKSFVESGIAPGGDNDSYLQSFEIPVGPSGNIRKVHNVIGIIPGTNQDYEGQSVVISAHYDHLGLGWPDAYQGNKGQIHNGADDNASGVAVMLELARILGKSMQPERTVVFAAFTAEEAGLLGSRYYVSHSERFPATKVIGNLNLDTVGRLGKQKLLILNGNTAREWRFVFMGTGYVTGVDSELVMQPLDASDQVAFIEKGVPAVQFFSGPHTDYHRPTDTVDKIDQGGLVKVATVVKETIEYLAARPEPMPFTGETTDQVKRPGSSAAPSGGRKVSTGIMPDFAHSGEGVKIGSVSEGSPAQQAGILKGDILVSFGGVAVEDLRQYSGELQKFQPGDTVEMVVLREGEEVRVELTLVTR